MFFKKIQCIFKVKLNLYRFSYYHCSHRLLVLYHKEDEKFLSKFNKKMIYLNISLTKISDLPSPTKFMKQCQEIKQSCTGQENFEICFCAVFDY